MGISFDEFDLDEVGGSGKVSPGDYHVKITSINENGGQKGEMIVDTEILCGTVAGMEGRTFRLYIPNEYDKWAMRKQTALALAAGLFTAADAKAAKAQGKELDPDWQQAVGRQIVICLEPNEYQGKVTTRLAYDNIYAVTDKRASHVPLHAKFLEAAGIKLPPERPAHGVQQAAATKPPAAVAAKPAPATQAAVDAVLSDVV